MEKHKISSAADTHFRILCLQIITVIIILVLAVILRFFGGSTYKKLSLLYHEKFDDITTTSEVLTPENSEIEAPSDDMSSDTSFIDTDDFEYELYDENIDSSNIGFVSTDDTEYVESVGVSATINTFMLPIDGTVTSKYGMRTNPVTGKYTLHGGLDIANVTGTEIKCAYDGVVSSAGYSDSYGYYVIVSHGSNVQTLYAHCSKLLTKKGENVSKGDVIALVGSTGRSTGPHLHFEVRIGGNRVDPKWLLGDKISI